jgi:hypothetical protein
MRSRSAVIIGLLAVSTVGVWSADNHGWQHKKFEEWTNEDAQAVMRDSPWAKRLPAPAGSRPPVTVLEPGANGAPPPSASLGNPQNTTTGTNMTVAGNSGSSGGADPNGLHNLPNNTTPSGVPHSVGAPEIPQPITIIWASAAPVRLAILKLRSGTNPPSEAQISRAHEPHQYYIIAVSGLPAPETGSDPAAMAKNAFLSIKSKDPVRATDSNYRKIGDSDVYFFRFGRSALPLAVSDKEVEFKLIFGSIEVRRKFTLKDMQYGGELAL